jgi:adenosylmethionine-8-amino-7-oxononanoate aminotransferase
VHGRPAVRTSDPRCAPVGVVEWGEPELFDNGLYCRPDDRGDVVVQVAPPLICGQAEFDEMEQILRHTLTEAENLV